MAGKPTPLGLAPSFGFGDRLGNATPGHLEALRRSGGPILGVFAQQSIREMTRTRRTATQVMAAAQNALDAAGFDDAWGADADHLKTPDDVNVTADAGFTFFTIDPSEHVDQKADNYPEDELEKRYMAIRDENEWIDQYLGKSLPIEGGLSLSFDLPTIQRATVKYGAAIRHAVELGRHIARATEQRGMDHEIEISVDETDQPTTLQEHYIIADQCLKAGLKLVSLAPRYIGEFEKGVDYKGDSVTLEASLSDHAAIARTLGPYKLSLHSGSDKLSMYTAFARATRGMLHVKTAGTSYLEALRVVARHDQALFRRMINFARERYDTDKATYHVSGTVQGVPAPEAVSDPIELEKLYLERWDDVARGRGFTAPGRQILHCTFGSTLTDPELGPALHELLAAHPDTYTQVLADHFARHLQALTAGMPAG